MRTILRLLSIVLLLLLNIGIADAKPRLTVKEFKDKTQEQDAPASAIIDMMVTELSKAGVFEIVERENFEDIADELELGQSGLIDPSMILDIGRVHSAQYTMRGAVTLYYYNEKASGFVLPIIGSAAMAKTAYVSLEVRIFSNTTGEVIYASEQLGSSRQEVKGNLGGYKGFFIGGYKKTYGGILASATRDAVMQHVSAIKAKNWE